MRQAYDTAIDRHYKAAGPFRQPRLEGRVPKAPEVYSVPCDKSRARRMQSPDWSEAICPAFTPQ